MAAAPQTAQAQLPVAASTAAAPTPTAAAASRWLAELLAAAPSAWDYAISLN